MNHIFSFALAVTMIAMCSQAGAADLNDWKNDLPSKNGQIAVDSDGHTVRLSTVGNTDMWQQRQGAPILFTDTPDSNFMVQADIKYPSTAVSAVAGICVYGDQNGSVPMFSFGLDHWGGTQKVKLQGMPAAKTPGLAANKPATELQKPGCREVSLKLRCHRAKTTGRQSDVYIAYAKFPEDQEWQVIDVISCTVPNQRIGLYLKTDDSQSVEFTNVSVVQLKEKMPNLTIADQPAPPAPPKPDPAATSHPLITAQPLLYVARLQYRSDHHNTATIFQTGEINTGSFTGGSALRTIEYDADGSPVVTTLLDCPDGVIRDPDVHFDGQKILFSMRNDIQDDYHIYEINADGTDLHQLTYGLGLSDIDPIYMPDGQIMFGSTREPKFCMCNRHIMCNLFTMEADGANVQQIGHSTLFEGHPCLLPDGRVLYDRWEYIDRNFGDAQGTWVTNPDGTQHAIYYGNNTNSPGAVLDARPIPGTSKIIATFSSCHDRPWGALAIIDRSKGIDLKPPVDCTWPADAKELIGVGNYDTYKRVMPKYEDPYALSDSVFICSRMVGQGEKTGIYLLDLQGHESLLHAEPSGSSWGCFDPMPLAARERPRTISPRTDLSKDTGLFYVSDVYIGTGMEEIPRGTVKWLRVVESPEKRFWTQTAWNGSGTQAPGMAMDDFNNKRILGTVPVEEDGSAQFEVPADAYLYFQLLDEQGRMIQSMRSGTIVRPGEQQGCIGCHEDRLDAVAPRRTVKALLRGPSQLQPWYGPTRLFSYLQEVQPVLDRNCLECHDYDGPGAKSVCLAGDQNLIFNCSYSELRKNNKLVKVPGAGPFQTMNPRSWGSYASPLAKVALQGHGVPDRDKKLNLTQEDKDRIVTWIDINAPYYARYASAYRGNLFGRSPLDNQQLNLLNTLTGKDLKNQGNANLVSFTRPEMSPALASLPSGTVEYQQALAIIEAGRQMLNNLPRADMAAFELTDPTEIAAEQKYEMLRNAEVERMRAIVEGLKVYDKRP